MEPVWGEEKEISLIGNRPPNVMRPNGVEQQKGVRSVNTKPGHKWGIRPCVHRKTPMDPEEQGTPGMGGKVRQELYAGQTHESSIRRVPE